MVMKVPTTMEGLLALTDQMAADGILVLEQGEITERGNHEELLSKKGKYSEMWNKQKSSIDLMHALILNLINIYILALLANF